MPKSLLNGKPRELAGFSVPVKVALGPKFPVRCFDAELEAVPKFQVTVVLVPAKAALELIAAAKTQAKTEAALIFPAVVLLNMLFFLIKLRHAYREETLFPLIRRKPKARINNA